MKYIIGGKVYDTEKSTKICTFEEERKNTMELNIKNEIYVTPKKQFFLVKYNYAGVFAVKKLDTKESDDLLDRYSANIDYDAYISIFEVEEA